MNPSDLILQRQQQDARASIVRGEPGARAAGEALLQSDVYGLVPCILDAAAFAAAGYKEKELVFGRAAMARCARKKYVGTVASYDEFLSKVPAGLADALGGIEGVAVCGGAALSWLTALPVEGGVAAAGSPMHDIDVFLFGETADPPVVRMRRVVEAVVGDREPGTWALSRTGNGVTVTMNAVQAEEARWGNPAKVGADAMVVQIIARDNRHGIAQALLGFDQDASAVAWIPSERRVVALPCAARALRLGVQVVDKGRQSTTFEARIVKYALDKGFDSVVPGASPREALARVLDEWRAHGLVALMRLVVKATANNGASPDGDASGGKAGGKAYGKARRGARGGGEYAGAVHGVDLLGHDVSFHNRLYNATRRRCLYPMLVVAPSYDDIGLAPLEAAVAKRRVERAAERAAAEKAAAERAAEKAAEKAAAERATEQPLRNPKKARKAVTVTAPAPALAPAPAALEDHPEFDFEANTFAARALKVLLEADDKVRFKWGAWIGSEHPPSFRFVDGSCNSFVVGEVLDAWELN